MKEKRRFLLMNGIEVETDNFDSGQFSIFDSHGVPFSSEEGWEKGERIALVTNNPGGGNEGGSYGSEYNFKKEITA